MTSSSRPYIPFLRSKAGEFSALGGISPTRKGTDIRPLVIIPDEQGKRFLQNLIDGWGGTDKFLVDPTAVGNPRQVAKFYELLLNSGLRPVPAVRPSSSIGHLRAAREIMDSTRPHSCIRISGKAAVSRDSEARLSYVLEQLECEPSAVDLILEFGVIADDGFALSNAVSVLERIPGYSDWRSVTFHASSIPEKIADCPGYKNVGNGVQSTVIPRPEMDAYMQLVKDGFEVGFSDSTVVFAGNETSKARNFRPAANLRYTVPDGFVLLRGEYLDGNEAMYNLCAALIAMPEYQKRGYSVGDGEIYRCAKRQRGPGASSDWRGWDINHHFEQTMEQLDQLASRI
jgi:hypothetical protein